MSPSKVRTKSNGGERFCRLSTWSPALAASTWQSELSSALSYLCRSRPPVFDIPPSEFSKTCRRRQTDDATVGVLPPDWPPAKITCAKVSCTHCFLTTY